MRSGRGRRRAARGRVPQGFRIPRTRAGRAANAGCARLRGGMPLERPGLQLRARPGGSRAYRAPPAVRAAVTAGWARRWWSMLSVAVQQAVASTALGGAWLQPLQLEAGEGPPLDSIVHHAAQEGQGRLPLRPYSEKRLFRQAGKGVRKKQKRTMHSCIGLHAMGGSGMVD